MGKTTIIQRLDLHLVRVTARLTMAAGLTTVVGLTACGTGPSATTATPVATDVVQASSSTPTASPTTALTNTPPPVGTRDPLDCLRLSGTAYDNCADEIAFGYFLRDLKAMQDMGLPVYWLGREFTAAGQTFRGPYGAEFGGEVTGGGIRMSYDTWPEGTPFEGPTVGLDLTAYSPAAWENVRERITNPHPLPNEGKVTRRTVSVAGHDGELLAVPGGTRPINSLWLILPLDNVVVVAEAAAGGKMTPLPNLFATPTGPDWSPFINDLDLLVQVMQNLRLYPQ